MNFEIYIRIRNFNLPYSYQICARTDVGIEAHRPPLQQLTAVASGDDVGVLFPLPPLRPPHTSSVAVCLSVRTV